MRRYRVKIKEILEKTVEIEARDKNEAEQIAVIAWNNGEYTLGKENFARVNFIAELLARNHEEIER